ncbi:endoribonuclease YBEY, chloroplastic isoform X2 [Alnus glutinosa]|uniref:endoribonuclease YBEY, chloroplastic isoform X2 n=1 Tax=Alnus glutinosa TaxID=3517 RepID=UPI002D768C57|nr:endoribonuclease YBEY, chloroplastic isoform X2 [Alnus glutinosa]
MLPRLSPLLRPLHPPPLPSVATPMARVLPRAAPVRLIPTPNAIASICLSPRLGLDTNANRFGVCPSLKSSLSGRGFHAQCRDNGRALTPLGRVWASQQREYRKVRRRAVKGKEKELELIVSICIEEDLPDDPEVLSISEMLRLNVPMAMKVAFDGLKDSRYKTRDTAISDVGGFESVELSLLLCNDEFICKLNKEWRDEDHATDVLSMSQHAPELKLPILMLGDIVISVETAARQAEERGHTLLDEIRILMARPAVISILKTVDLAGKDGIVSEFSPGVFLQGLLVYGRQGREIFRRNLDPNVCREACLYSWENKVPLIAFTKDRCLTLFDNPLVDSLHTVYHEPKAEIMPSVEHLLAAVDIQKLIFLDTSAGVSTTLRPYWSEATRDRATVVQAVPDMLEIVPLGTSKGSGVKMLLDHLGSTAKEVMAIGDGENDVEMLELAALGIALSNGSEKTKAVANEIGASNDEDGVADAIYRYAF